MLRLDYLSITKGDFSVRNLTLEIAQGEYFMLLGRSGTGKTTLLETIIGMTRPASGHIYLGDVDITHQRIQDRDVGMVFQDQLLFPHLSVRQNITYGLKKGLRNRKAASVRCRELANQLAISHLLKRRPATLSAGETRRVALARALASRPLCLLLDEPLVSLDSKSRSEMRVLLRRLNREGCTIVHVTHDFEEAISLAHRIGIIGNRRILQVGTPDEVFKHPESEFVARFVGIRNFVKGELVGGADTNGGLGRFVTAGPVFMTSVNGGHGPGYLLLRSTDITIANEKPNTSARNVFDGTITDIERTRQGMAVTIDVGVELVATVTERSLKSMAFQHGRRVWVSFKATAGMFVGE